jgi:pimeloyl-ACP methyl ester carboxylesterase
VRAIPRLACIALLSGIAAGDATSASETFVPVEVCQTSARAVVVETKLGRACIRYAASANVQGAPLAIMSLHGDRDARAEVKKDFAVIERERLKTARQYADTYGWPWVMIARPGVYGSSGDHRERRELLEFLALDAAVSAIKARYGIKQLALMGHSGGATAVGAMLTLGRDDVACAVMTSGAFSLLERQERRSAAAGRKLTTADNDYDPLDHIRGIRPAPNRRIIVAGDPRDTNTHFDLQKLFAERVRAAGHGVELVELKGVAPSFHNIGTQGLKLVAGCADERTKR